MYWRLESWWRFLPPKTTEVQLRCRAVVLSTLYSVPEYVIQYHVLRQNLLCTGGTRYHNVQYVCINIEINYWFFLYENVCIHRTQGNIEYEIEFWEGHTEMYVVQRILVYSVLFCEGKIKKLKVKHVEGTIVPPVSAYTVRQDQMNTSRGRVCTLICHRCHMYSE